MRQSPRAPELSVGMAGILCRIASILWFSADDVSSFMRARSAFCLLAWFLALAAAAAPRLPTADDEVLERLPSRATAPRLAEMQALRQRLARNPQDADTAVALVRRYVEETAAEGDPRYIGYGQAALAPWWSQPAPPPGVRVMRAVLRQFNHEFEPALADLAAAAREQPDNGEAWSWQAAINMVQARYAEARAACDAMKPLTPPVIATACAAAADSLTGQAAAASTRLRAELQAATGATPEERLWALTRLAEIDERRGDWPAAEAAFRQALALGLTDGYLLAAYADFLLDRGRAGEVLTLLQGKERSDLLLLRLALAGKAAGAPQAAGWARTLEARFAAARLRGDSVHQKEESRFLLGVLGQADRALTLAQENYALQREPADARVLLEAALGARRPETAAPVLRWMEAHRVESVALAGLVARLKAGS